MHVVGGSDHTGGLGILSDPAARTLVAGDLEAVFLSGHGMLGASLRHRGAEILGRVQYLEAAAAKGSTAGIPLLQPWANRLAGPCYQHHPGHRDDGKLHAASADAVFLLRGHGGGNAAARATDL